MLCFKKTIWRLNFFRYTEKPGYKGVWGLVMKVSLKEIDLEQIEAAFQDFDAAAFQRFFQQEIERKFAAAKSSLAMLPTSLHSDLEFSIPKTAFSIDWGGTHLRFSQFAFEKGGNLFRTRHLSSVESALDWKQLPARKVFVAIAKEFLAYLKQIKENTSRASLGLAFSFAFEQSSLEEGKILGFSKGYQAESLLGQNPLELLRNAFLDRSIRVRPKALVNDATATYLAGIDHPHCCGSAILGTGFNLACLLESKKAAMSEQLYVLEAAQLDMSEKWTDFDRSADLGASDFMQHSFEKMLSGAYLGRVFYEILLRTNPSLEKNAKLFFSQTKLMSIIESAKAEDLVEFFSFNGFELQGDLKILQRLCSLISERSIRYFAHSLYALASYRDPKLQNTHAFIVDGSVFLKYHLYAKKLEKMLKDLSAGKIQIFERPSASARGAALASIVLPESLEK